MDNTTSLKRGNNRYHKEMETLDQIATKHIKKDLELTNGRVHGPDREARILAFNPYTFSQRMGKLGFVYGCARTNKFYNGDGPY